MLLQNAQLPKRNLNVKSSVILFSNFWTRRFSWFTLFKYCEIHEYFVIRISNSGFLIQDWVWVSDRNKINDNGLSQLLLEQRRINSFYGHFQSHSLHGPWIMAIFRSFMRLNCAYADMSKFFMTRIDTNLENENNFVEIAIINGIVIVGDYQNISF